MTSRSLCDSITGSLHSIFVKPIVTCATGIKRSSQTCLEKAGACKEVTKAALSDCCQYMGRKASSGCNKAWGAIKWSAYKFDENFGIVTPLKKARNSIRSGDYSGAFINIGTACKLPPRTAQAIIFLSATAQGQDVEKVVPILLLTTTLNGLVELASLMETKRLRKKILGSETTEDAAENLALTNPNLYRRMFGEPLDHQKIERVLNYQLLQDKVLHVLSSKALGNYVVVLIEGVAGYIFINSGNHKIHELNQKEELALTWVASNAIVATAKMGVYFVTRKNMRAAIHHNQTPTWSLNIGTSSPAAFATAAAPLSPSPQTTLSPTSSGGSIVSTPPPFCSTTNSGSTDDRDSSNGTPSPENVPLFTGLPPLGLRDVQAAYAEADNDVETLRVLQEVTIVTTDSVGIQSTVDPDLG